MGSWELFELKPPSPLRRGMLCTTLAHRDVVAVPVPRSPQGTGSPPQPTAKFMCQGLMGGLVTLTPEKFTSPSRASAAAVLPDRPGPCQSCWRFLASDADRPPPAAPCS